MFIRFVVFFTLLAFLNTILGCTKIMDMPVERAVNHSDEQIYAIGLHSSCSYNIKLEDVAQVHVMRIRKEAEGGSVRDTITADVFEEKVNAWMAMKIVGVVLKSGEEISLEDRNSYYEAWSDAIKVAGSVVVFDSQGGRLNLTDSTITGLTQKGEAVAVTLDEIAYVRQKSTDNTTTLLVIGGVVVVLGIGFLLFKHGMEEALD